MAVANVAVLVLLVIVDLLVIFRRPLFRLYRKWDAWRFQKRTGINLNYYNQF